MLEACELELPQYSRILRQMTTADSHVLFGKHLITSDRGVQQGDPVGPLVFIVGKHSMVSNLTVASWIGTGMTGASGEILQP